MTATTTNQLPLMKRIWGNGLSLPLYEESRFLSAISKDTQFVGEGRYVIVGVSPTSGGAASFATAYANQGATNNVRFFVTRKKNYQVASIEGETLSAVKADKGAVIDSLKRETKGALYAFARDMAFLAWNNGGGARGRVDGTVAGFATNTYIQLRNRAHVVHFEVGMYLKTAVDDGLANGGTKPGRLRITAIDRSTGVLRFANAINDGSDGIATIADGDYLFREGDYNDVMTGMGGWNPQEPIGGSDSFWGQNRFNTDTQRVSGLRFEWSGDYEAGFIEAAQEASLAGIRVSHAWMNPLDFKGLLREVGTMKEARVTDTDKYGISFRAVHIQGPHGIIEVHNEPNVPQGYTWMNNPSDIYLRTAGECPKDLFNPATKSSLWALQDADAFQLRFGAYGNFTNEEPGNSVQIKWGA